MVASFGEILFDVYQKEELLGGAPFNFFFHIHALTGNGVFISRIGNDERGKKILSLFKQHSIDPRYVQIDPHHPTGAAFVSLADNGIPTFTIAEDTAYDYIEPATAIVETLAECDVLYFGTLAQRNHTSRSTLHQLSRHAKRCFFDVNLRQHYYTAEILQQSFALADIVKLNDEELEKIHPLFFTEPFSLKISPRLLMEKFSLSLLAVTMGENGSWIWTPGNAHFHKTTASAVCDTVGAGDAFAAMMCLGVVQGWDVEALHKRASEFSAAVCGITGALPISDSFYEPFRW